MRRGPLDLLDAKYENKVQYSTPGVAGDGTAVLIQAMPNLGIRFPAGKDGGPSTFALPYAAGLVSKAPHDATATAVAELMDGVEAFRPDCRGAPARLGRRRQEPRVLRRRPEGPRRATDRLPYSGVRTGRG